MYSQNDLDEAVAAGAISADSAAALRGFVETQRALPGVDEEHFRLITGFNDIFVAIASAILLFAVGWIGQSIGQSMGFVVDHDGPSPLAPLAIAATAWGLALFFTAKRRMALPSIMLLLAFVGGIFAATAFALATGVGEPPNDQEALIVGIIGAVAGAICIAMGLPIEPLALLIAAIGNVENFEKPILAFVLLLGVGVFLFAMRWDSSDPARVTRRSDVAFWLHLLAAPMIVHPVFTLLGLNDGTATIGEGLIVIALYVALGLTALAIDRRALLVSALAYVLYALSELFKQVGAVELNIALTALVIGSALLLLSAYWHQARSMVVRKLPEALQSKLPNLDRAAAIPAPAA